jgi:hypothetical protein
MKTKSKRIIIKKHNKKLKATFTFNEKQAIRLFKTDYYRAQAKNIKAYEFIEKEKRKLSTPKWEIVTELIDRYRELGGNDWTSSAGRILKGIYEKNKQGILNQGTQTVTNTNLVFLASKPEMLLLAYKAIKGNRGAMTGAERVSLQTFHGYNDDQRLLYLRSIKFPDGFNLQDVLLTSKLIRKGLYPWGTSKRVYVPKPGTKKQRPITIPPFMDKVVQKSISFILQAIYEPEFERMNRSFGFRPNKGTHDAIVALTSLKSSGKTMAIEGDIQAAYDTVNRKRLLDILNVKITDRKFINLIKDRLEYDFVEKTEGTTLRQKPKEGIPQGGIDSPYLFNIYMLEFDKFVHMDIQGYIDQKNLALNSKRSIHKNASIVKAKIEKEFRNQKKIKDRLRQSEDINITREDLFKSIKSMRLLRHEKNKISTKHPNKKILYMLYVRYADDWILLTNGDNNLAKEIKEKITHFLKEELFLTLSSEKTSITDITKQPAKFLGFELRHPARGPLIRKPAKNTKYTYKKYNLQRKAGTIIWATIDRQRQINKFYMKGLCNRNGFPKEVPWLSTLEPQVIVERFNASIRGLAEFYLGYIRNISDLQRWIYIIRYSCLKTLAQKYKTSINGVFKKFGINHTSTQRKTIQIKTRLKIRDDLYERNWNLLTYKDIKDKFWLNLARKKARNEIFWSIEEGKSMGNYPLKQGSFPSITNDDFLEKLSWVSLRTQANFDMPCANCGCMENIQQHHVKHIRKTAYQLISKELNYKKVMALRNRKQIPLCALCHRNLIHAGKYTGQSLIRLVPTKLMDNRIVHVESFVKPGIEYHAKSLEEKGWKKIPNKIQTEGEYNAEQFRQSY